jgi:hypothetical protein
MPLKIGPVQWYIIGSLKAAAAQAKDEEIDSTNNEIARLKKATQGPNHSGGRNINTLEAGSTAMPSQRSPSRARTPTSSHLKQRAASTGDISLAPA